MNLGSPPQTPLRVPSGSSGEVGVEEEPMTWKPIVAGVDGSPESIDAAALAWRIAEAAGTKCVFVYALPEPWPGGLEPLLYTPQVLERLTAEVRRLVEQGL